MTGLITPLVVHAKVKRPVPDAVVLKTTRRTQTRVSVSQARARDVAFHHRHRVRALRRIPARSVTVKTTGVSAKPIDAPAAGLCESVTMPQLSLATI